MRKLMKSVRLLQVAGIALVGYIGLFSAPATAGGAHNLGPKASCMECHEPEYEVYKGTQHFKSFKSKEHNKKGKKIVKAVAKVNGGKKNMKRNKACALCHFTIVKKKPKYGPSCESCHGAASEWVEIHNDYGGKDTKADTETAEHKVKRHKDAAAAGMIWPRTALYEVAENCNSCHGLAHPDLSGDELSTMLDAGHPAKADFELIQYFNGSNRHRFYPPNPDVNQEMTKKEASTMFVVGHIAKLVSATEAAAKSKHEKFTAMQQKRADNAKAALSKVSIAAVKAFVKKPTRANGLKAVDAIKGKDLSGEVGSMLPKKSDYK